MGTRAGLRRLAAHGLAALCVALAACGGDGADDVLTETGSKLAEIRSGELDLRFLVSPETAGEKADLGFELAGRFALARPRRLPVADMRYIQIAGKRRGGIEFVSTGTKAFVEVKGLFYELPAKRVEGLRSAPGTGAGGPLGDLGIEDWTEDAEVTKGPNIDGQETERVRADVDVVNVLNDLTGVARQVGGGEGGQIRGEEADQLRRAVRSARLNLVTGAEDRLLRRLDLDLGLSAPQSLPGPLGELRGARVGLSLRLAKINRAVKVAPPEDPLPFSALGG